MLRAEPSGLEEYNRHQRVFRAAEVTAEDYEALRTPKLEEIQRAIETLIEAGWMKGKRDAEAEGMAASTSFALLFWFNVGAYALFFGLAFLFSAVVPVIRPSETAHDTIRINLANCFSTDARCSILAEVESYAHSHYPLPRLQHGHGR